MNKITTLYFALILFFPVILVSQSVEFNASIDHNNFIFNDDYSRDKGLRVTDGIGYSLGFSRYENESIKDKRAFNFTLNSTYFRRNFKILSRGRGYSSASYGDFKAIDVNLIIHVFNIRNKGNKWLLSVGPAIGFNVYERVKARNYYSDISGTSNVTTLDPEDYTISSFVKFGVNLFFRYNIPISEQVSLVPHYRATLGINSEFVRGGRKLANCFGLGLSRRLD